MLPVDDKPQRDRLHPARRQAAAHLLPEHRAKVVTDQAVEDPPGLLGVDEPVVDGAGVVERVLDSGSRDLVEDDAAHLRFGYLGRLDQVPRDGLPFPVRVGREIDGVGRGGRLLELRDNLSFVGHHRILGLEPVFDSHADLPLG